LLAHFVGTNWDVIHSSLQHSLCHPYFTESHSSAGATVHVKTTCRYTSIRAYVQSINHITKSIWIHATAGHSVTALLAGTLHGGAQIEPTGGNYTQIITIPKF
jgi:hypothetical protein